MQFPNYFVTHKRFRDRHSIFRMSGFYFLSRPEYISRLFMQIERCTLTIDLMRITLSTLLLLAILVSCQSEKPIANSDDNLRSEAKKLADKFIIVDGHVDLPYRLKVKNFQLEREYLGIPVSSKEGDFDFERARKGGLDAPFMAIYVPARKQLNPDMGKNLADSLIDMVQGIIKAHPDKFASAGSPSDVEANTKAGKVSLPMGMENGAPIGNDIANVLYFQERGIRYITLTHSRDNQICDSSYDTLKDTHNGLSPFGERVVREMNRVGIMVDISHVSDSTFYDVIKITSAPVIASHSSCRHFTPGFQRNMSDEMIRVLARNGGVIQINFGASFIDSVARSNSELLDSLEKVLSEKGLTSVDSAAAPIIDQFVKDHRQLYSDVERVADHIDHVVKLVGIDYVGLGSDFDGVGDTLPIGLKDVSQYPNLIYILLKRGYTEDQIDKICSGNVFRVWNKVLDLSKN
jgi:membrane dipeptidase